MRVSCPQVPGALVCGVVCRRAPSAGSGCGRCARSLPTEVPLGSALEETLSPSLPPALEGDTPPLSSSGGSPGRPQDLLFTAGFLLRTPARVCGLGLWSVLLSLLCCVL